MIKFLATDLDGTLIPLEGVIGNRDDLQRLKTLLVEREICIIFVTGRHIESVQAAIDEFDLPVPEFIIADVGSSIYRRSNTNATREIQWEYLPEYQSLLDAKLNDQQRAEMQEIAMRQNGVRLQEREKTGPPQTIILCRRRGSKGCWRRDFCCHFQAGKSIFDDLQHRSVQWRRID